VDKETSNYIRNFFSNLMTDNEKLALKHHMYTYKADNSNSTDSGMKTLLMERGLIRTESEILDLLKDGYEQFELSVAKRIMTETPEKVFLNNCPKCNKLARTPYARQCRFCGHSWHALTVAQFKLNSSFQLTGRLFFLLGEITKGEIKQGQFIDLTMLGLNKRPKIESIEFALKRQDGKAWEDVGLGTIELTEEDKEYLKNIGSFGTPFDIISER
jgi:hypothetical protein